MLGIIVYKYVFPKHIADLHAHNHNVLGACRLAIEQLITCNLKRANIGETGDISLTYGPGLGATLVPKATYRIYL